MLRLLGALGVFCALSWCGFQRALWYRQRVDCIAAWQNALREGERQLCDLGIQTPEWLGWIREQKLLSAFAEQCQIGLERSDSLSAAWRAALIQAEFPLEKDELSVLASVGEVVGRYDGSDLFLGHVPGERGGEVVAQRQPLLVVVLEREDALVGAVLVGQEFPQRVRVFHEGRLHRLGQRL